MSIFEETHAQLMQSRALAAYLTGVTTGLLKHEDTLPEHVRQNMARHLMWCYKKAGVEMTVFTKECLNEILGKDTVEKYITSEIEELPF